MSYGLQWAIKRSFLQYIAGLADGQAVINKDLTAIEDELVFPPAPEEHDQAAAASPRRLSFIGEVRFGGHAGMMFVRISDPQIEVSGQTGVLSIADPTASGGERVPLVTFTIANDGSVDDDEWRGVDVRLTPAGVPVFNEVYDSGELFEDFVVRSPKLA